jgi:hypothetical protein
MLVLFLRGQQRPVRRGCCSLLNHAGACRQHDRNVSHVGTCAAGTAYTPSIASGNACIRNVYGQEHVCAGCSESKVHSHAWSASIAKTAETSHIVTGRAMTAVGETLRE